MDEKKSSENIIKDQKIINEIEDKVPAVRLSLRGEPMLHPNFIECVRYAKNRQIKEISTLTNGSKLTPEYFTEIFVLIGALGNSAVSGMVPSSIF